MNLPVKFEILRKKIKTGVIAWKEIHLDSLKYILIINIYLEG